MKITVTKTLGALWATPDEFADMSDDEILDLIQEDITEFLSGAVWRIIRGGEE